jgi:hypothetical protein
VFFPSADGRQAGPARNSGPSRGCCLLELESPRARTASQTWPPVPFFEIARSVTQQ